MKKLRRQKQVKLNVNPLVKLNQIIFKHKDYFGIKIFYLLSFDQMAAFKMKYFLNFLN